MLAHRDDAGCPIGVVLHDHPVATGTGDPNFQHGFRVAQAHTLPLSPRYFGQHVRQARTVITADVRHFGAGKGGRGQTDPKSEYGTYHHGFSIGAQTEPRNSFMTTIDKISRLR